jgi:glycosyltransferase involved in cell wall biosynthesis
MGLIPGSGIDLDEWPLTSLPKNERVVFLMVARLLVEKGVGEYCMAASLVKAKYKHVEFRLIGYLDESHSRSVKKSEIEEWTKLGIIDYQPYTDHIREEMIKADCVVLPSYREGTPRTLLEAAAVGRPLIATDVPGCREVVKDQVNGLLCKPKNADSLAESMDHFLKLTTEKTAEMANQSRKIAEEVFDETIVIKSYHDRILSLTEKTRSSD